MTNFVRQDTLRTGRGLEEVCRLHGLPIEKLIGKTMLDLGCGGSDLGLDIERAGLSARVIAIDAHFDDEQQADSPTLKVQGNIGHAIDLPDKSVDIAIASYSLPMWARHHRDIKRFFSEARRVIRPLGMVSVYPMIVTTETGRRSWKEHFSEDRKRLSLAAEKRRFNRSSNWEKSPLSGGQLLQVMKVAK